jgi:hypothetical protein
MNFAKMSTLFISFIFMYLLRPLSVFVFSFGFCNRPLKRLVLVKAKINALVYFCILFYTVCIVIFVDVYYYDS